MSGLFASLSVGRAWEKFSSFLRMFSSAPSSSSSETQDNLEELRKMERTMLRILATLHDAEDHWNIREESSKLRLRELKDLAYDMEDVVDGYEYEVNRRKVEALEQSAGARNTGKRKRQEENNAYSVDIGVVAVPNELVHEVKRITERFNEIAYYSEHFTLSEYDGERRVTPDISSLRHTGSVVSEKSILGRDYDLHNIIEKVLPCERKSVGSHVAVLAIVGMGGLGKTTLAQLAYNNRRVQQAFDKFAWVCVSERFDIKAITRNIISSLTKQTCQSTELSDLQENLAAQIREKRFLLVLDDVWNERRSCWELLCMPMSTTTICQIIITTRSEAVARLVQTVPSYHPNCLSSDESWSLFKQVAFPVDQEEDIPANLMEIGKSIVRRCKGLPLAVKTLGCMLRYEPDQKRWENVLGSELWDLEQPRNEVLPALELSYRHMPTYLRRCFVALSLLPKKDRVFSDDMIKVWTLLDLLHCNGTDDKYAIGTLYLKELVQRSIIQVVDSCDDRYVMHDLIHDLACFLSAEEFYRYEEDTSTAISQNVRYLSIPGYFTSFDTSIVPHSLRAIILFNGGVYVKNPQALSLNCKNLRAVHLSDGNLVEKFSTFVGRLKLLRHFSSEVRGPIKLTNIGDFFQLYNLKTLDFGSAHYSGVPQLTGIRGLINLHILPEIYINKCGCSCDIRELRNINKIRKLIIWGLGSISRLEDVMEAQLMCKRHLQLLNLDFSIGRQLCRCILQPEPDTISHDVLLESLEPYHDLSELRMSYYKNDKYPGWLGSASFSKLTRISFYRCESKYLPTLGGLPSLKELSIRYMNFVEHIGQEFHSHSAGAKAFPSLKKLEFDSLLQWSEWSGMDYGDFPRLHTISIRNCHKLCSLPLVPFLSLESMSITESGSTTTTPASPTLRDLLIRDCGSLRELPTLPSLLKLSVERSQLSAISSLPSLTNLVIKHCLNLSAVSSPPSLTTLVIKHCLNLSAVHSLPSLTILEIEHSQYLTAVSSLPSLTTLVLKQCLNLSSVSSLPSLTILEIEHSPYLSAVSSLPSLTTLVLKHCLNLSAVSSPPSLTTLVIKHCLNMSAVRSLPSLTTLEIEHSQYLSAVSSLPSLTTLVLKQCLNLSSVSSLPSLVILEIEHSPYLSAVSSLPSLTTLVLKHCLNLSAVSFLPSLTTLKMAHCPNLSAVSSLPSLTTLTIKHFPNLHAISSFLLNDFSLLPSVGLPDCSNLTIVGPFPSLTTLVLERPLKEEILYNLLSDLPSLECLEISNQTAACIPLKQQSLPSLRRLCFKLCLNLRYCDGLAGLTSLEHLEVLRCPKLPIYNLHPRQRKTLIINDNEPSSVSYFPC